MAIIVSRAIGVDTLANRPAFGTAGRLFFATDNNTLYVDTGAAWTTVLVGATTWVTTSSATTAFDALDPLTTKGDILTHDGTNSVRQAVGSDMALPRADSTQTNGLAWARRATGYCMRAGFQGTGDLWTFPAGGGDPLGGGNQINYHKLDFSPYREARVHVRGRNTVLSAGNVDFLVYDTTNAQNITAATSNFANDGVYRTRSSAWGSLNSATYAGDAEFELRVANGAVGDTFDVGTVILELR